MFGTGFTGAQQKIAEEVLMRAALLQFAILISLVIAATAEILVLESEKIPQLNRVGPAQRQFGRVEFLRGFYVASESLNGISSLRIRPDHTFLAISENREWLRGKLSFSESENLEIEVESGVLPAQGEALAENDTMTYVGFEGASGHRVWAFDSLRAQSTESSPSHVNVSPQLTQHLTARRVKSNEGIESLVYFTSGFHTGKLLAILEGQWSEPAVSAFLIDPNSGVFTEFLIKRDKEFDVSDAAELPNGDLLLLERQLHDGVSWMRLRLIPQIEISVGDQPVIGKELCRISNDDCFLAAMEGLSVQPGANGSVVFTVISDNSFEGQLSNTEILQFRVSAEAMSH